jgi:hypothetical protein
MQSPQPWDLSRTRALKFDESAVFSLSKPSLVPTCGHSDTRFTCTRVPHDGDATVICESCFTNVRDVDAASRRTANPPISDQCILCGGANDPSPVRMHADIAMPVCDACVDNSRTAERANDAMREVPLDVEPDEVVSRLLFIGAKESAANAATLARLGISRVLICCDSLRAYHEPSDSLRYHRLPIADSLAQDLRRYLPTALAFIAQGALKGARTLVHCNAGVSRSGSIVVEWLRRTATLSLADAWAAARGARPCITPNSNFVRQLLSGDGDDGAALAATPETTTITPA